ncbi:MAG: AAA family ATPase, partial [Thermomicrobiales bacterium]|nr:AAA family ATPase [Thermomicrobiales bacterium]
MCKQIADRSSARINSSRPARNALLHLLFPDRFERISSDGHKQQIVAAFPNEAGDAADVDDALLNIRRSLEARLHRPNLDFYDDVDLRQQWDKKPIPKSKPSKSNPDDPVTGPDDRHNPKSEALQQIRDDAPVHEELVSCIERPFPQIVDALHKTGMRIHERDVRRYHAALRTRGFVILSGLSGSGKTWLAEAYAEAIGARSLIVPVAPNWTANEDLLGYFNPLTETYHDTAFSRFLREAAATRAQAETSGATPPPFHVVLDEMN